MSSSSFEEAVQFALERLHMDDLDPKEEQLSPLRQYTMVCLPTGFGKKFILLPGHFFRDGLQAGQSWDFHN